MRWIKLFTGTVVLLCILAEVAWAARKPTVRVEFDVKQGDYVQHLGSELDRIEEEITRLLTERLTREFGFLEFLPAENADHTLTFELRQKKGTTLEVGFHANLDGDQAFNEPIYMTFREDTAAGVPLGTPDAFAREIALSLQDKSLADIGERLLGRIPISGRGSVLKFQQGVFNWELAFQESELCMDRESVIKVQHFIPGTGDRFSQSDLEAKTKTRMRVVDDSMVRIAGPIEAEVRPGQENFDKLEHANLAHDLADVKIGMFFVIDYRAFADRDECARAIPPEEVEFGGGE